MSKVEPKFSELVGDLGEPITSIESYQNPVFGFLNVLVINNGMSQWFIAKEVVSSLGYNTVRVDRIIKKYIQPSEIRILKTANMPNKSGLIKVTNKGLYIISENGVFQLVLNSPLKNAIEYKVWVANIIKQIHHTGVYKCEIEEANKHLNDLFKTSTLPQFDLSPYQQGAYVDVVSLNQFGEIEVEQNYKLRVINAAFFLLFRQTYSCLDPQSSITGKIEPFDIAFKFGGGEAVNIVLSNIQFILNQLTAGASLLDLETWIYFYYPGNYTPRYNIPNGTEIQKLQENNNKKIKEIDAEVVQ